MHSIQIWRALPEETNPDNLIGDIFVIPDTAMQTETILANFLRPQNLAGQTLRIPGTFEYGNQPYLARANLLEVAALLDRDSSTKVAEPMLDPDAGSHALTVRVFDCAREQRELAQLAIVPHATDPFLCDAAWSPVQEDLKRVLTVRFWPFPLSPWTVLRVATHLLRVGSNYGSDVAAFHYTVADDFSALPGNRGSK